MSLLRDGDWCLGDPADGGPLDFRLEEFTCESSAVRPDKLLFRGHPLDGRAILNRNAAPMADGLRRDVERSAHRLWTSEGFD